tara:strand:- start:2787 stop:3254 length:468 start_codon:yes stop_codon:yes gene_type:complete
MDSVTDKFKANGSFKDKEQNQEAKKRYKLGGNGSRYEFSPISNTYKIKDKQNRVITKEVDDTYVKKLFGNPYMELRAIKGRSLGVYFVIPEGLKDAEGKAIEPSTHFRGYASFNDSKTQLTMDDHAEDVLECAGESITAVKSEEDVMAIMELTAV